MFLLLDLQKQTDRIKLLLICNGQMNTCAVVNHIIICTLLPYTSEQKAEQLLVKG